MNFFSTVLRFLIDPDAPLFEKNSKVFEQQLFSTNSSEALVTKSKITGTRAETVDISSVVHCTLSDPFVPTHRQGSVLSLL